MFSLDSKILIVDDMRFVRSVLKTQLRTLGFTKLQDEENGDLGLKALYAATAIQQPFQLVLSDWNMPVMSGIDLLKAVRTDTATFGPLPFILITAEGEAHQVKEALELKVTGYIRKPFTATGIQEHLEAAWKRHETVHGRLLPKAS